MTDETKIYLAGPFIAFFILLIWLLFLPYLALEKLVDILEENL